MQAFALALFALWLILVGRLILEAPPVEGRPDRATPWTFGRIAAGAFYIGAPVIFVPYLR